MQHQRWRCPLVTRRVCSVDGCEKAVLARGWCKLHYSRWRRQGDPEVVLKIAKVSVPCLVDGCSREHFGRGWCQMHYDRWRTHGDPLVGARPDRVKTCTIVGCEKPHSSRGWCGMHYLRWAKHGDPLTGRPPTTVCCQVCDHPLAADVESDLSGGSPLQLIADQYELQVSAIGRHRDLHLGNPEWHAKRAAWWANELAALQAE